MKISRLLAAHSPQRLKAEASCTDFGERTLERAKTGGTPLDKATLLAAVRAGYAGFEAALTPLSAEQMTMPGVSNGWSIKDILAHIAVWQERVLDLLMAAKRGTEPDIPVRDMSDEAVDRLNEEFYEQRRAQPLDEARAAAEASYRDIVTAIEALSEDILFATDRLPWIGRTPLWQIVAGDTYEHYEDHVPAIRAWVAARDHPQA